jgi:hypothetical protein
MKKGATGGLLLAGLAAYAYYKYNKMTPEQKEKLVGGIKEKGQKIYDQYVPEEVKKMFGKKKEETAGEHYGEGDAYTA